MTHSPTEINDASEWLLPLINNRKTKLLNDDIVDEIKNANNWDVAMMYNGDLLSAISDNPDFYNGKYLVVRPYMGTNVIMKCISYLIIGIWSIIFLSFIFIV